jgi:hypothetical protein
VIRCTCGSVSERRNGLWGEWSEKRSNCERVGLSGSCGWEWKMVSHEECVEGE